MISITLQFPDIAAAAQALARMAGPQTVTSAVTVTAAQLRDATGLSSVEAKIAHADRPDVGAAPAPAAPPADPLAALSAFGSAAAAFGGAVAQAAPLVSGTTDFSSMAAALNAPPHMPIAPPTPPAAPSAPSAATGPTAALAVERDSTGLVWDARIHASTKTKTAAGVWTAKRNTPPELKAQIEADLRGLPAPNPLVGMPAPTTGAALPPQAPAAPPVAPPQAPAAAGPKTFPAYMAEIGEAFANRPVDAHNAMAAALATVQLANVSQLAGNPQLIPAVDAEFKRLLG